MNTEDNKSYMKSIDLLLVKIIVPIKFVLTFFRPIICDHFGWLIFIYFRIRTNVVVFRLRASMRVCIMPNRRPMQFHGPSRSQEKLSHRVYISHHY